MDTTLAENESERFRLRQPCTSQNIAGRVGIDRGSLSVVRDADFLYGPRDVSGKNIYVLCEINVSCVFAIPDDAPASLSWRLGRSPQRAEGLFKQA